MNRQRFVLRDQTRGSAVCRNRGEKNERWRTRTHFVPLSFLNSFALTAFRMKSSRGSLLSWDSVARAKFSSEKSLNRGKERRRKRAQHSEPRKRCTSFPTANSALHCVVETGVKETEREAVMRGVLSGGIETRTREVYVRDRAIKAVMQVKRSEASETVWKERDVAHTSQHAVL